jgi:putative ABC transport system permease protein
VAPWAVLYLYRARLRARVVLVQELLAVVGIAVGVALLFASQVASTSLDGSIRQLAGGVVGRATLQVQARGPRGFEERLLGQVRRLPGVRGAEPVLEQRVTVVGPAGQRAVDLIAGDPSDVHIGGGLLRRFTAAQLGSLRVLALPAPLAQAIGVDSLQTVQVVLGARTLTVLMGATLDARNIGALVHSPVAIAPLAYAQQLTGLRGRVTRILVLTAPGRASTVRAELVPLAVAAGANVELADHDARLFETAATPADQSEELFSAISALVGFMFAFNAMLVTAHLRRGLVLTLRERGATRAMTVQVLLGDALVLGVLGTVVGLALGEALSAGVFGADPGYLSFAFPVGAQRIVTARSVALAAGMGLAAACVGVFAPLYGELAWRGRPPGAWLRDRLRWPKRGSPQASVSRLRQGGRGARVAVGALCLATTTAILLARPQSAVLGAATLVVALLLLLPLCFDAALAGCERLQRPLYAASTRIALVELGSPVTRMRSLAIAATGAIAVFGSVAVEGARSNLQRGLDGAVRGIGANAAVWVIPAGEADAFMTVPFAVPAGGGNGRGARADTGPGAAAADGPRADTGLGAAAADSPRRLARLPGVSAVRVYRGGFLDWGERRVWVLAPPRAAPQPVPAGQLVQGTLARADAALRGSGWAVLSQTLAAAHGLRVGARFTLPAPRPTTFTVAALATNLGWPPGAVILNAADYARAWGSTEGSAYQVELAPGASPAAVRAEIRRALGSETGLRAETAAQWTARHYATTRQALARLSEIGALVLVASVLAMAGAMGSMIWQRRPQLAYIKRQGYRRGVLWRALVCESALLLGVGCLQGALFGVYGQLLLSHALASVTGFPVVSTVGGVSALASFAAVSAAAVAILAVPGYLAVRVRPTTVSTAPL